jgi:hypothetical protein
MLHVTSVSGGNTGISVRSCGSRNSIQGEVSIDVGSGSESVGVRGAGKTEESGGLPGSRPENRTSTSFTFHLEGEPEVEFKPGGLHCVPSSFQQP